MTAATRVGFAIVWRGALLAAMFAFLSTLAGAADAPASRVVKPSVDAGQGDKCVADTEYMRRNHMKLLLHQRDETVHAGVRPQDTSLERCIACHASRETKSVVGSDRNFCQGCHSYAAVKIDCFECHASKPSLVGAAK
jgi:[DsrC]-trisulfide reductase subunit J